MKLPGYCCVCHTIGNITVSDLDDDCTYEVTCDEGHKTVLYIQQQKFEVLFEIGANAILDKYYREAVMSFSAGLERFYEFVIRTICIERGIPDPVFDQVWKPIGKLSERQLGAFMMLYGLEFGKPPKLLGTKDIKLRNDVAHNGRIPSLREAMDYGQAVLDVLRPILAEVKERIPASAMKTVLQHLILQKAKAGRHEPGSTIFIPTIVNLAIEEKEHNSLSLEDALKWLRGKNMRM